LTAFKALRVSMVRTVSKAIRVLSACRGIRVSRVSREMWEMQGHKVVKGLMDRTGFRATKERKDLQETQVLKEPRGMSALMGCREIKVM